MKSGLSKNDKSKGKVIGPNEIQLDVDGEESDDEPQQLQVQINDDDESDYYDEEDDGGPQSPPSIKQPP